MLKYVRCVGIEAEGPDVEIVDTTHDQSGATCESSVLYQHVLLGAQDEFQTWLEEELKAVHATGVKPDDIYARRKIGHIAAKWTKDLSTEVLLLLAADDKTLVENRGDWPAAEPAIDIIRGSLKADILITLATLWGDTCRELLSSAGE